VAGIGVHEPQRLGDPGVAERAQPARRRRRQVAAQQVDEERVAQAVDHGGVARPVGERLVGEQLHRVRQPRAGLGVGPPGVQHHRQHRGQRVPVRAVEAERAAHQAGRGRPGPAQAPVGDQRLDVVGDGVGAAAQGVGAAGGDHDDVALGHRDRIGQAVDVEPAGAPGDHVEREVLARLGPQAPRRAHLGADEHRAGQADRVEHVGEDVHAHQSLEFRTGNPGFGA
jgi:hypothetical protein